MISILKYIVRVMAMPMLLVGSAGGIVGFSQQLWVGNGQFPQTCDYVGALRMSIAPAVISAVIFVCIVEVANYSRWKLLICLFVVVTMMVGYELSSDTYTQETDIRDSHSVCLSKNTILLLSMWIVALAFHSSWKFKAT